MAAYAAWLILLAVIYCLIPGWRAQSWALVGMSCVAALAAGIAGNRPARMGPWLLLAGACASMATSQAGFLAAGDPPQAAWSFPWIADAFSLAAYPLGAAALLIFLRSRLPGRARQCLTGALILAGGLAFACWLGAAGLRGPGAVTGDRAFAVACAAGGVLVLVLAARLATARPAPGRAAWLLVLGAAGLAASDLGYALTGTRAGTAASLGWVLWYAAWGAAALDPAMTWLTEPVPGRPARAPGARLAVLAVAGLAVPGALLALTARQRPAGDVAVGVALFALLVLGCAAEAAVSYRRALARERALGRAGAAFAAALTMADVAAAAQAAVTALAGRHPVRALLAVRDGGTLRAVPPAPGGAPPPLPGQPEALPGTWLAMLAAPGPHLVPAAPGDNTAAAWDDQQSVLLCPLAGTGGAADEAPAGVLAAWGGAHALAALAPAVAILAGRAGLAAGRVTRGAQAGQRHGEAYFRTLVQDAADAILIVSGDGTVEYATPAAARVFGTAAVAGARVQDLAGPGGRDAADRLFTRMRDGAGGTGPAEWQVTRPDGTRAEVMASCRDLRADDMVGHLVLTLRDVSEQRALERELAHRAFHDALTGLPNRTMFTDRVTRALASTRRPGTAVAVLVVDLDDFNVVNDSMGHTTGDELLVAAARRLTALADTPHTAARLGADEFALLLEEAGGDASVDAFAQRIVDAFTEPFALIAGSVTTTATVGVATTEDSTDAGDLVRHADLALYAAKAAGKRQWRRYRPVLSAGIARRRELKAAIEEAVTGSAFTLVYQPIVALAPGEIAGFEALVRWPHPRWGMIHPDQFIALAEETGYIVPLGSWVLRQAISDLVAWQRRVPRQAPLYVSVNVSARQFRDPGFVAGVRQVLSDSGLAPSRLLLELTESVLLGRDDRIRAELTELKRLGVRLAIDDFGTGYSSLSYLRELPMDVIKIDRSFIEGIAVSKARLALVEVIVRIAKTLGLAVVAEGIESEVQRELLISLGCEFGQGYLLEKPVAADEAEALIRGGLTRELHATAR